MIKKKLLKFINRDKKLINKEVTKLRNFYDTMPKIKSTKGCWSLLVYNILRTLVIFFTIGVVALGTLVFMYYTWVFFYRVIFSSFMSVTIYKLMTCVCCFIFVFLCRVYLIEFEKVYYKPIIIK